MLMRTEQPADRPAVLNLVARAFAAGDGSEPVESRLLAELYACDGFLPEFSLVAEDAGTVVGQVISTRGWIDGAPALGLGPIAVEPDRQRAGIGAALLAETRRRAEAAGESVIVLLGSTDYYPRFGYRPASESGIQAPNPAWGENFMALPLASVPPTGAFAYAEPFGRL
ncbi:N-acetyltransferase [Arthrobacter sp. CAU 1506]|nr:N-acetyltransferase [Arthrobacter sp. CAU 1506]